MERIRRPERTKKMKNGLEGGDFPILVSDANKKV
jgi:hypothetical protein